MMSNPLDIAASKRFLNRTYYMDSHASYSLILRLSLSLLGKDNKRLPAFFT